MRIAPVSANYTKSNVKFGLMDEDSFDEKPSSKDLLWKAYGEYRRSESLYDLEFPHRRESFDSFLRSDRGEFSGTSRLDEIERRRQEEDDWERRHL